MKGYERFKIKELPNYLYAYEIVPSGLQMKQTKLPFSAHVELCGYCNLISIILAGAELEPSAVLLYKHERDCKGSIFTSL